MLKYVREKCKKVIGDKSVFFPTYIVSEEKIHRTENIPGLTSFVLHG